jgi:N-formylglutamate deformylase
MSCCRCTAPFGRPVEPEDYSHSAGSSLDVSAASRREDALSIHASNGASNTELCPLQTFALEEIYLEGRRPDAAEVEARRAAFWQPYHDCIKQELAAIKARHGFALLWDAHSIRSEVPRFFAGRLPDLNLGTADGKAAAPGLLDLLSAVARDAEQLGYTHAANGRFKGGYITRSHGRPEDGVHAVQLELSQITYMDEDPPFTFRDDLAAQVRPVLSGLVHAMLAWAEVEQAGSPSPSSV